MNIIPNAVVEKLYAVEPGSLIYIPFGHDVVPAIKGHGEDQAGELHDVFTLLPIPCHTDLPTLITPEGAQCVLNFGTEWTLEPPVDSRMIVFGETPSDEDLCGLVIAGDRQYLRVSYVHTDHRMAFLDLSTGDSIFRPPEGPQAFLAGWIVRQRGPDNDSGEDRIVASWRAGRPEFPGEHDRGHSGRDLH